LARAKRGVKVGQLTGEPFAASWNVDEITLVCSQTLRDGARYDVLERYRLSGQIGGKVAR
jgi:2'-5' RNA ligase